MEQLMINCNGQDTEYKWIKAEEPLDAGKLKSAKKRRTKTLNSSFGRKTTIRISAGVARRRTKSAGAVGVSRKLQPISSEGIKVGPGMPWRTAARANRYRGFPPEHIPGKASLFENSEASPTGSPDHTASIIIDREEDEDTLLEMDKLCMDDSALSTGVNNIKDIRIEMIQMRRQMQQEKLARAKAEKRVVELSLENKRMHEEYERLRRTGSSGGILEDDSVLESIEVAFKQFNSFLDLLRDAGLGQLITMAGLDHQDSPFVSASRLPKSSMSFKQTSNQASKIPPRPAKPGSKLNGYLGDISSSNRVSPSGFNHDSNGHYGHKPSDPTMKSNFDDSFEKAEKAKKDDLYERILQETSGAFRHTEINLENVSKDSSKLNTQDQPSKEESKNVKGSDNILQGLITADKRFTAPVRKGEGESGGKGESGDKSADVSADSDWNRKHGVNLVFDAADISELSDIHESVPVPKPRSRIHSDDGKDSKQTGSRNMGGSTQGNKENTRPASRISDYNYSMDSFEQSYLSERGEVIRLDGDFDTFGSSPSPAQVIDSEENDF